jgi:hypothetical protein
MVPTEGVEPTHSHEYQILSLARLPIPPHRQPMNNLQSDFFSILPLYPVIAPQDTKKLQNEQLTFAKTTLDQNINPAA